MNFSGGASEKKKGQLRRRACNPEKKYTSFLGKAPSKAFSYTIAMGVISIFFVPAFILPRIYGRSASN
jgi:hypothetical protein